jgi:hypothetical protein
MSIIHIVGINTFIKQSMIDKFKEMNFEIYDLDEITKDIMFNYKRYDIGSYWKKRLNEAIQNFISNHPNKNIIILGLSSFVLDHRYKVNIPTNNKFFYSIPYDVCASQLITYNIDTYKNDIIEGSFPIKYLDHDKLMLQRKDLQEEYTDMEYRLKTPDMLSDFINKLINNNDNKKISRSILEDKSQNTNIVYLAFIKRFEEEIPKSYIGSKSIIIAYKDKWMAIASILPKSTVKRGMLQNKSTKQEPYLKELHVNAFAELKKPCYIYELKGFKKLDLYRFEIADTKIINREYVSNMYDELIRNGVVLDNFKF